MIKQLYEAITGTPWTTVVGGPMLAADYPEWLELTDAELMTMTTAEAIAWAHQRRAESARATTAVVVAYDEMQHYPATLIASR